MTHNMKIKYPFYISENPFIHSLFHTAGFVSHTVKYISHTVVFVFHSVKQRIHHNKITYIQKGKDEFFIQTPENMPRNLNKFIVCIRQNDRFFIFDEIIPETERHIEQKAYLCHVLTEEKVRHEHSKRFLLLS